MSDNSQMALFLPSNDPNPKYLLLYTVLRENYLHHIFPFMVYYRAVL